MDCRPKRNAFFTNWLQDRPFPCSDRITRPGISLWNVGKTQNWSGSGEDAQRAVLRAPLSSPLVRIERLDLLECSENALLEQHRSAIGVEMGATLRLRDYSVGHAALDAVQGIRLERRRCLPRLARVTPEDRGEPREITE